MRKTLILSCLLLVAGVGCNGLNDKYTIISNTSRGEITITGKNVKVSNLINQMIAANGWKQESAGSKTLSTSNITINNGKTIKDVVNTADTWIVARANDGTGIRFDIHTENDNRANIKISIDGDETADVSRYTAELLGWFDTQKAKAAPGVLKLTVAGLQQDDEDRNLFVGTWASSGSLDSEYVDLEINYEIDGTTHSRRFNMNIRELEGDAKRLAEADFYEFEMPGGVFTITAEENFAQGFGQAKIQVNPAYVQTMAQACSDIEDTADADTILRVFFSRVDAKYAMDVKEAMGGPIPLAKMQKLSNYHVSAEYLKAFVDAGYAFDVDGLIKLKQYHVEPEYAGEFKQAEYELDVNEIIKLKNYHVKTSEAAAFKKAGYDLDVNALIKAKNYHLSADDAATFKKGEYDFDLNDLIKLKQYHVSAPEAATFKEAGYQFGASELIKAHQYHLGADFAAKLKTAGYDFLLDELIRLKQYNVSLDFMLKLADDEYENFSASELIDMKNKNISADMIEKLRKKKEQP